MRARIATTLALAAAIWLAACDRASDGASFASGERVARAAPDSTSSADASPADAAVHGDAERGAALAVRFECARCHTHDGLAPPARDKNCASCHALVAHGALEVGADAATLASWRAHVRSYLNVPSLTHVGARLRRSAIAAMLREPRDVRPRLAETMPRLALTATEAADLATWLAPDEETPTPALPSDDRTLAEGRRLVEELGCGLCHARGGDVLPVQPLRVPLDAETLARGIALAPDLAQVGTRVRRDRLVAWLLDPRALDPNTAMPALPRTRTEAVSVAAWLLYAPVIPRAVHAPPARLPLLARRVTFAEVQARVFRRSCWHCHSEPDFNEGDGGPGNTGGLGFTGRGLSLASAAAVRSGARGDDGTRHSVLSSTESGTPRLVEVLLARQREEAGEVTPLRGMPLGLSAVSAEDVQLVESWIAGGAAD